MARAYLYDVVLDTNGTPTSGASVQVNVHGGAAATLYTTEAGGVTASNPLTTAADGSFNAWVAEGTYDLVISGSGLTTETVYRDLLKGSNEPGAVLTATGDIPYASAANTVARLAAGADGRVLRVTSGVPVWDTVAPSSITGYPSDVTKVLKGDGTWAAPTTGGGAELDYKTITSPSLINTTTEGTAASVITGNSITYDGTKNKIEFSYPSLDTNSTNVATITFVFLRDSTVVGQAAVRVGNGAGAAVETGARTITAFDTPSAAAHTYAVKAFVNANSANVNAGAGGSGALLPAVLRVAKA